MTDPLGLRWVSCSKELSWDMARYRHLLPIGREQYTTLCGGTGMPADVWRGSEVKPPCLACTRALAKRAV